MNQNNNIHLGIAIDQNYITFFYVLLTSVFSNNKKKQYNGSYHCNRGQ